MSQSVRNDALERKLQPIYDALDARNWKGALKLADAALKKFKHNQLIRALKSFALVKSGRQPDALQLCCELVKEGPEDDAVLNTLTFTYKAADRVEGIMEAYLAATERQPANVELLTGLFAAYVRNSDYVKQQQTATRLVKAVGGGEGARYTWWAVCSLVLQARQALLGGPSALPADKLLQLAETMASRQMAGGAGGGPATFEELLLVLDILQGQGKHKEALQLLGSIPSGSAAVPLEADRQHLQAAALARSGDKLTAAGVYRNLVLAHHDDWACWGLYLDCMLPASSAKGPAAAGGGRFPVGVVGGLAELWDGRQPWRGGGGQRQEEGEVEAAVQAVQLTLAELDQVVQGNPTWREQARRGVLRGPALARLEVAVRKLRLSRRQGGGSPCEAADAAEREVAEEVLQAYRITGGNASCTADLRGSLAAISSPPLADWLAGEVHAAADEMLCWELGDWRESERESSESGASSAPAGAASKSHGRHMGAGGAASVAQHGQQGGAAGGKPGASSHGGPGRAAGVALRRFQAKANAFQIEAELGLPRCACSTDWQAHAAAVLGVYRDNLHLSASLDSKDRGYGEELVGVAVAALLQAAQMEPTPQAAGRLFLKALLVLEAAQVRRQVSAPLRLGSCALYSLVGAPTAAAASLAALDIKFILHDTLTGHWALPGLLGGAAPAEELRRWLGGVSSLHREHGKEAGETLMMAFTAGTHSKVVEFVDFKERLAASHTRALGQAEEVALKLRAVAAVAAGGRDGSGSAATPVLLAALEGVGSLQDLPDPSQMLFDWRESSPPGQHTLRFNEDLSTRPLWLPPRLGACRLAVTEWWEGWARGGCQGAGAATARPGKGYPAWTPTPTSAARAAAGGAAQCWWWEPGAAHAGASAEAATWRQGQLSSLTQRFLLPGLLSATLSSRPSNTELAALRLRLHQLAAAQGVVAAPGPGTDAAAASWQAELDTHLERRVTEAQSQPAPGEGGGAAALVGDVSLALWTAAHAVHAALLSAGTVSAAHAALSRLGALLCALCRHVTTGLSAPTALGALPAGGSFCLASALLLEDAVWVAVSLQAWLKLLQAAPKNKSPGGQGGGEGFADLREAMQKLAGALTQEVTGIQAALAALLEPAQQQQVHQLAAELDVFGVDAGGRLWDLDPEFKPREVLQRVVGEQRAVAGRLEGAAKALLSMLRAVQA